MHRIKDHSTGTVGLRWRPINPIPPMTVSELIAFLQTQPQDLPVAYRCCSESCMLKAADIELTELCVDREDGWVPNKRPDKASRTYLLFPGN